MPFSSVHSITFFCRVYTSLFFGKFHIFDILGDMKHKKLLILVLLSLLIEAKCEEPTEEEKKNATAEFYPFGQPAGDTVGISEFKK